MRGVEEVGVRALARAAHPAADLVELGQPERVGALDDQRVGVAGCRARPRRSSCRRARRRRRAGSRASPSRAALVHLAVGDGHARLGHDRPDPLGRLVDRLHAVVQEEDLAAALAARARSPAARAPRRTRPRRCAPAGGPRAASRSPRCRAGPRATSGACAGSAWPTATARPRAACSWRSSSFCFTPKRCSSSTISRPRSFGRTSRESSAVRADQDVDLALAEACRAPRFTSFAERKRETISIGTGSRAGAR